VVILQIVTKEGGTLKRKDFMKVFVFTTNLDKIWTSVKAQFSKDCIELCTTVSSIALKLFEARDEDAMAVLLPADEEELIDIYFIHNTLLFQEIPVMLVLPTKDEFVEALGYRLRPCLMCYREGNIAEAVSVLKSALRTKTNIMFGKTTNVFR
jgi:hypothetical protein